MEQRQIPETYWLTRLAKFMNFRFTVLGLKETWDKRLTEVPINTSK